MTRIPTPGGSPSDIPSFAHAVDGPLSAPMIPTQPTPAELIPAQSVPVEPIPAQPLPAEPIPAYEFGMAPMPSAPVPTAQPLHMAGVLNPAALGGHPGYPSDPGPAFAAPGEASATAPLGGPDAFGSPGGPTVSYTVRVNGAMHVVDGVWIGESLLHVLRERLGLPGAKDGCGQGVCGTCTVLVDGAPAVSCMLPAATMGDREITTIEGLADLGVPTAVRQALIAHGAVQCGFCVPGVVVSAHALLARIPQPDEATVRRALAGHPCRCAGPNRMVAAVCAVAAGEAAEPPASLFEPTGSGGAGAGTDGTAGSGTAGTVPSRGDGTMSMGIISIPPGTAAGPAPAAAG